MDTCVDLFRETFPDKDLSSQPLTSIDALVLALYFVLVLIVGFASLFRSNRGNAQGYFLAGGNMWWFPVGASLFSSNIGSEHFLGLAGSGAKSGIAIGAFELNAMFLCQIMAWVFLPVYFAGAVYTLPEYLHKRFGGQRLRMYTSVLSLLIYIFSKISVDLFAGAIYLDMVLGWNIYLSISLILAVVAIYTIAGGLAAVIYTDTLQTVIMLIGACILSVIGFKEVGGMSGLEEKYNAALSFEAQECNSTCGYPNKNAFVMLRSPSDKEMPWPGFFFGMCTASLWYVATDQIMVQRALAAKNLSHAKGAAIFHGLLKITPMLFIVFPGMIARVLFPETVGCVDPAICKDICGVEAGCSNLAYPMLVMKLLPSGLRGLMLAVMISAIMSSLTSIFNSSSTLFTMDIWRKLRNIPDDNEMGRLDRKQKARYQLEIMVVGRLCILFLVLVSVLWIPVLQNSPGGQLFHYMASINAYIATPIAAIFTLAVLWERINETGAFWAAMIGLFTGFFRLILNLVYKTPPCGEEDKTPYWAQIMQFQYMYFALFNFALTSLCAIAISFATEPIPPECLYRLTFWTRFSRKDRKNIGNFRNYDRVESKDETYTNEACNLKVISTANNNDDTTSANSENISDIKTKAPVYKRLVRWFCGFNDDDNGMSKDVIVGREEVQINKIYETKRNKIILGICVVIIVLINIFLYIYWSVRY